jgi:hypothetical protein
MNARKMEATKMIGRRLTMNKKGCGNKISTALELSKLIIVI